MVRRERKLVREIAEEEELKNQVVENKCKVLHKNAVNILSGTSSHKCRLSQTYIT